MDSFASFSNYFQLSYCLTNFYYFQFLNFSFDSLGLIFTEKENSFKYICILKNEWDNQILNHVFRARACSFLPIIYRNLKF